jgi:hypothetical protein
MHNRSRENKDGATSRRRERKRKEDVQKKKREGNFAQSIYGDDAGDAVPSRQGICEVADNPSDKQRASIHPE